MTRTRKLISIVAPVFNEAGGLEALVDELSRALDPLQNLEWELIFIDDGSTDDTVAEVRSLIARSNRVRAIELSRRFGKEAALTAGLDAARGDAVIPIDADLQDPPSLIPAMVDQWLRGAEVVLARRRDRRTDSLAKRLTARGFYSLHRRLSHISIPENVGDFRLMDRAVVDAIKSLPERQRFMKGLFAWVGFRTCTIDYDRAPRHTGQSKFSGWRLWNLALEGFTSFSTVPLRVWTYIGLVGAATSFTYGAYIILRTLIHGADVPGYASLLVAVLFLGSLQLISIGMVGEYLGRIYMEAKQRPTYIVRRVHQPGEADAP